MQKKPCHYLLTSKSVKVKDWLSTSLYQKKKKNCCRNTHFVMSLLFFFSLLLWFLQQVRMSFSLRQKHPVVCVAIIPCDMSSQGEGIGRLGGWRLGKGREEAHKGESNAKTFPSVCEGKNGTKPLACISSRITEATFSWVFRASEWCHLACDHFFLWTKSNLRKEVLPMFELPSVHANRWEHKGEFRNLLGMKPENKWLVK